MTDKIQKILSEKEEIMSIIDNIDKQEGENGCLTDLERNKLKEFGKMLYECAGDLENHEKNDNI